MGDVVCADDEKGVAGLLKRGIISVQAGDRQMNEWHLRMAKRELRKVLWYILDNLIKRMFLAGIFAEC